MPGFHLDELPVTLRQKWAAARVWAAHEVPYLANALLALDPVVVEQDPDSDEPVADLRRFPADTGWHIHLDPAELDRQTVPQVGFWLVHQLTHLLREHAERYPDPGLPDTGLGDVLLAGRTPDQQHWNLAADAEIDDELTFGALVLPEDAATPAHLGLPDGDTAENYWTALRERPGSAPGHLLEGDCGSGCDGQPRLWNCDWPGLSRTSAQLTALDTARRIREHQRVRDDIPAGWLRWAQEVLQPTVNWRRLLSAQIRRGVAATAGRVDFTYRRPSRRAAGLPGIILPSLRQPLPAVAMVVDTSGSMSDTMLGQALAEVMGVLRAIGIGRTQLKVISCDAQAYQAQTLRRISDLQLGGGGGTDIGAGIAAATALRPPPDLIVAITDGHTPWPDRPPPRTRVVVGLLDPGGESPEWAETVIIGDQQPKAAP